MAKKKRLSDLSATERKQFYDFVDEHKKDKNILCLIYSRFGIDYSETSMKYVFRLCNRRSEQRNIERDNAFVKRWNSFDEEPTKNYADHLAELLSGEISEDEFKERTHGCKI